MVPTCEIPPACMNLHAEGYNGLFFVNDLVIVLLSELLLQQQSISLQGCIYILYPERKLLLMFMQLLNDERAVFIAFHFFFAGVFAGIFLMRYQIKKMKKNIQSLERELQREYEDNIIHLPEKLSTGFSKK